MGFDSNGVVDTQYYPYTAANGDITGYKIRTLPKSFSIIGKATSLFGMDLYGGGGKRLIITEGEIDAMSVQTASYERYKQYYPVISVASASTFEKAILAARDWLRSFQEVILCLDSDKAGQDATARLVKMIGIDKVKLAKLPCKDANDVIKEFGTARLLHAIWDAQPYIPAGIIDKERLWEELISYNEKTSHPYPSCLTGVNSKIKGQRSGEIALFVSGTGAGKSTLFREIMLHSLETTTDKIGIVSLEESPAETARKLSGMYLLRNPAEEEIPIEELKRGFDHVFGDDRFVILDHQGSIKDGSIVDRLEYMCLAGCKQIFVDHITILVSEGSEELSGNEAIDKIMNDLLRLVKSYDVWIGLISHLRKVGNGRKPFEEGHLASIDDIRGSVSIKQISFDIVAFARDMTAADDFERNVIKMSVLKSRYTGLTGPIPGAWYNNATGRLQYIEEIPTAVFDID